MGCRVSPGRRHDDGLVEDDQRLEALESAEMGPGADADAAGAKDQAAELRQGSIQRLDVGAAQLKAGVQLQSVDDAVQRGEDRQQVQL